MYIYICSTRVLCTRAIYPRRFVHSFAHIHKREAFVEPCKSSARCTNTGKERSRAQHPALYLCLLSLCISLHMALRLLPISERSYVTRRELFALASSAVFPCLPRARTYVRTNTRLFLSLLLLLLFFSFRPNDETDARLRYAWESCMYPRVFPTLSIFTATASFPLFLPASSIKRKRTHFSPPSAPRPFAFRHPCPAKPGS